MDGEARRSGVRTARADDLGRLQVTGIEPGPVRLRVTPAGAPPVHTAWVLL